MSAPADDSYARHERTLLDQLSEQLSVIVTRADSVMDDYRNQLSDAKSRGFMSAYIENLGGDKQRTLNNQIDNLKEAIRKSRAEIAEVKERIKRADDAGRNG